MFNKARDQAWTDLAIELKLPGKLKRKEIKLKKFLTKKV